MKRAYHMAVQVAVMNTIVNVLLSVGKLLVGYYAQSTALISDGVHSVVDVFSTLTVIVGIWFSSKGADEMHPYGCERLECVAAIVLAVLVAVTGGGIALSSVEGLVMTEKTVVVFSPITWLTALVSIGIKEGMFRYTKRAAIRSGSTALMADAWHQRTDAMSSVGSLLGIVGTNLGWPILDPLAGLLIAALIVKAAVGIFVDAMRKMTDRSCERDMQEDMRRSAEKVSGVLSVEVLKTRLFGSCVLAEITVCVQDGMSAKEAYHVAQTVKLRIEKEFEDVKTCSVHIHPSEIPLVPIAK